MLAGQKHGLWVRLAFFYIFRADDTGGSRLYLQGFQQVMRRGGGYVRSNTPADIVFLQFVQQLADTGKQLCMYGDVQRVEFEQADPQPFKFRILVINTKPQADERSGTIGYRRTN